MNSRVYSLAKWGSLIGIPSLVLIASAMAAETETAVAATPSFQAMAYMLVTALCLALARVGAPSKKTSEDNQKVLVALLEATASTGATAAAKVAEELKEHRHGLDRWIGGIDEKLATVTKGVESVTGKIATVEREVGEVSSKTTLVNYRLKALERKAGIDTSGTTGEIPR